MKLKLAWFTFSVLSLAIIVYLSFDFTSIDANTHNSSESKPLSFTPDLGNYAQVNSAKTDASSYEMRKQQFAKQISNCEREADKTLEMLNEAREQLSQQIKKWISKNKNWPDLLLLSQHLDIPKHTVRDYLLATYTPNNKDEFRKANNKKLLANLSRMPFSDFINIVNSHTFTSYDIAMYIKYDVDIDRLKAIIARTPDPNYPPVSNSMLAVNEWFNVADMAASRLNINALKVLAEYGVLPSSQLGFATGLDYAIHAINDSQFITIGETEWKAKQKETIKYLIAENYSAHLYSTSVQNGIERYAFNFTNEEERNTWVSGDLLTLLKTAELIDINTLPSREPRTDELELKESAMRYNALDTSMTQSDELCTSLKAKRDKDIQLYSKNQILEIFNRYYFPTDLQNHKLAMKELYKIDAGLAHRYAFLLEFQFYSYRKIEVRQELRRLSNGFRKTQNDTELMKYLSSNAMDELGTAQLLNIVFKFPELTNAWKNRGKVSIPESLSAFNSVSRDKLEKLDAEGFDLEIVDKWGQDLFVYIPLEEDTINYLLSKVIPANPDFGADALDRVLDNIYIKGEVPSYASHIIDFFPVIEKSHLARMSRLKAYRQALYEQLVKIDNRLIVNDDIAPNPVLVH